MKLRIESQLFNLCKILPSVKNSAFGDDFLVDLGARIECQRHGLASKASQQVPKNMNLEEIVQKHKKNE